MKTLSSIFFSIFWICSACCAGDVDESQFVKAITTALRNQDRDAFYELVCFEKLDKDWIATNKAIFEINFREAKSTPSFEGSISRSLESINAPMPTLKYNCSVTAAYLMHIAPGTTMNIPLCLNNGEFKVACKMLREQ